jgi:tetratricopeptide (TPR) repeat protein
MIVLNNLGDYEEAIKFFDIAIKLNNTKTFPKTNRIGKFKI